jgi:CMP-N,N'-diacetyllegionaminic acid synthase
VKKSALALIPARGGSKGVPGKNLAPVAGKPLVAWTLEAALASRSIAETVVSTDSDEIAAVARSLGAAVLERPAELARDDTPMQAVIDHARTRLPHDLFVLLQPTSPLRRPEHVDGAVDLLVETGADIVVSVVELPHAFLPSSLMRLEEGRLVPLDPGAPLLRQQKAALYARNGPAVLAFRRDAALYEGDVRAYVMDARDSLDVDGPFELELVSLLLSSRGSEGRSAP